MSAADALYRSKGFGGRVGFGKSPALVVIDLVGGWTTPDHALGADHTEVIKHTNTLLEVTRRARRPVLFSTMAYDRNLLDAGFIVSKIPALEGSTIGSETAALHPDLDLRDDETIFTKKSFSCFVGTPLQSILTSLGVDTLLIAGCSTSACVRATATDALGLGFRPIVVREAVGDRAEGPHIWNLFDIDAKFGDVEDLVTVLTYLNELPE